MNKISCAGEKKKEYSISSNANSEMNLQITKDTHIHYLYSKYSIEREMKQWIENASEQLEDSQYILLIGWGLGYHIRKLIQTYPNKKYFVYEPDHNTFSLAIEHIDFSNELDHSSIISVAVGEEEDYRDFLEQFAERVADSFVQLTIPSYNNLYHGEIEQFTSVAIEMIKMKRSNLATYNHNSDNWIRNILRNTKYVAQFPSVHFLADQCKDKPVIIVGAGPSLQYDLDLLRELKHKVTIIAAGTSTQALLKGGVEPDIIVSMDGGEPNRRAFESLQTNHIPMVFGTFIQPEILNEKRRRLAYAILEIDQVTPYLLPNDEKYITFKSNYSVTGLCIQLAVYMGCSTIIFTGQDLSFPNNKYYADGVNHFDPSTIQDMTSNAHLLVENVYGETNNANHSMFVTLRDIEHLISMFDHVRFINASRYGAKIRGTTFNDLNQIKDKWLASESKICIPELFDQAKQHREEILTGVINQIKRDITNLDKLNLDLLELLRLFDKTRAMSTKTNVLKNSLLKISRNWSAISQNDTFKSYIQFGLVSYFNSYQRYISEVTYSTDSTYQFQILDKYLCKLIKIVLDYTPTLKKQLESTVEEMK